MALRYSHGRDRIRRFVGQAGECSSSALAQKTVWCVLSESFSNSTSVALWSANHQLVEVDEGVVFLQAAHHYPPEYQVSSAPAKWRSHPHHSWLYSILVPNATSRCIYTSSNFNALCINDLDVPVIRIFQETCLSQEPPRRSKVQAAEEQQ